MRTVKIHDKAADKATINADIENSIKTGEELARLHASKVTEETRYAHVFTCGDKICSCTMHWRKEVNPHANTVAKREKTFVKNRSSTHRPGCTKNYADIAQMHENVEYTNMVGDALHVKINFPLGSAKADRFPEQGWLTEQQRAAVSRTRNIRPYANMKDLIGFVEKNFELLDGEGAAEIVVNYQGNQYEWGDLFISNDRYNDLLIRAYDYSHGMGIMTEPAIVIAKPMREVSEKKGMRQFNCEGAVVFIGGYKHRITPAILCDSEDPTLFSMIKNAAKNKEILALAVRPYVHGADADLTQPGGHRISLLLHRSEQVTTVPSSCWKALSKPQLVSASLPPLRRQLALPLHQPRMAAE